MGKARGKGGQVSVTTNTNGRQANGGKAKKKKGGGGGGGSVTVTIDKSQVRCFFVCPTTAAARSQPLAVPDDKPALFPAQGSARGKGNAGAKGGRGQARRGRKGGEYQEPEELPPVSSWGCVPTTPLSLSPPARPPWVRCAARHVAAFA